MLDPSGPLLPRILHWGRDVGPLGGSDAATLLALWSQPTARSSLDEPGALTLLPAEVQGWSGTPGFAGHRSGGDTVLRWSDVTTEAQVAEDVGGEPLGGRVEVRARDQVAGLSLRIVLELDRDGVLTHASSVTNDGSTTYDVGALRALMPLPSNAFEILDLTGRWCRERSPQRRLLGHGTHQRSSRRGRTGHDATLVLIAGTPGFGFRSGEVWGVHVAWSGDHEHLAERLPEGAGLHGGVLGGGELLRPGEVRLEPGETYATPPVLFTWSAAGMDGLAGRLHQHVRARPSHPRRPRPLVLNTWEAVYFDHDLDRMKALADVAKSVGVERFVIDDGWFRHRRSDDAGLGDWYVDEGVWPDGLHPIVDHVRGLGLQIGLWVEPEMVNLDSDLARAHPDWLLDLPDATDPDSGAPPWRRQHVLDLAHPEASAYILERLDALVTEYALDYLKWDHNRDLHAAQHRLDGRLVPGVRLQTLAVYAPARRAPAPPPAAGDRVLRQRRRPGRPRHPGPHRPGVGLGHQRRHRAAADPALDREPAAPGAGRLPRRAAALAHDVADARPVVPAGDRAVRPRGDRVGPDHLYAGGARPGAGLGRPVPASCARCCTPEWSCGPTRPTTAPSCTEWWPRTGARRCSASPGSPRRRPPLPGRVALPGLDPGAALRRALVPAR